MRAKLVRRAGDWRWSSARAHLGGKDDRLPTVRPLLERAPDWPALLRQGLREDEPEAIRAGERTGRPLGLSAFIAHLEKELGWSGYRFWWPILAAPGTVEPCVFANKVVV